MVYPFIILIVIVLIYLCAEHFIHQRRLSSIPIRIHINGTRGKSSITRLIAGALREHGIKTFAKTTGTLPRMIMDDGREYPIYRPAGANIIEQLRVVSLAACNNADALVIECMAVQPYLQSLSELKLIRATHGVITNVRKDHLDVMGPTKLDVALALMGTVPYKGKFFTAEQEFFDHFNAACSDRDSEFYQVTSSDIEEVTDKMMEPFDYIEHKENVALVLKICETLGVKRQVALAGMYKAKRDTGAMSEYKISFFGRDILFINGFAANDPESTELIWRMSLKSHENYDKKIMVISSRADRPDRSKQLGQAIATWPRADNYVLMGSGVYALFRTAIACGIDSSKFVYAEGIKVEEIFEEIVGLSKKSSMVMGIGNIVGPGLELVNYFSNRCKPA
jgi:gamma-polyglutamate synthase